MLCLWGPLATIAALFGAKFAQTKRFKLISIAVLTALAIAMVVGEGALTYREAKNSEYAQWWMIAQQRANPRFGLSLTISKLETEKGRNPDDEALIRELGLAYFGNGQYEKALIQLDRAIEIANQRDGLDAELVFYRAGVLHLLDRSEEAKSYLEYHRSLFAEPEALARQYRILHATLVRSLE
jgi:tetratricopeptide (TPR) repeat protein